MAKSCVAAAAKARRRREIRAFDSRYGCGTPILERSDLVQACAKALHTNARSTRETVKATERLGTQLGLRTTIITYCKEPELRAVVQRSHHPGSRQIQ